MPCNKYDTLIPYISTYADIIIKLKPSHILLANKFTNRLLQNKCFNSLSLQHEVFKHIQLTRGVATICLNSSDMQWINQAACCTYLLTMVSIN